MSANTRGNSKRYRPYETRYSPNNKKRNEIHIDDLSATPSPDALLSPSPMAVESHDDHPSPIGPMNAPDGLRRSEELILSNKALNTRKGYKSRLEGFIKWLTQKNYNDCINKCGIDHFSKICVPLPSLVVREFLGDIARPFFNIDGTRVENHFIYTNKKSHLYAPALGTVSGYKTALVELYKRRGMVMDNILKSDMEEIIKGYKLKIADFKKQGMMKTQDGKLPISFGVYSFLAMRFLKIPDPKESTLAWPYWVLLWNTMQRSETVASLQFSHISWNNDSLVFTIPKSKNDQDGDRTHPRHLFANPLNPHICPILSTAVLVFTTRYIEFDASPSEISLFERENRDWRPFKLFPGTFQEGRMSKILSRTLDKIVSEGDADKLEGDKNDIGMHSPRKGVRSYLESLIDGPSEVAICHRGGWKLGGVHDTYSFAQNNQDEFCGRCASGLPFRDPSFTLLPPFLTPNAKSKITTSKWKSMLPLYNHYKPSFRCVLWYLFASLVYHQQWLLAQLGSHHPLISSVTWGIITELNPITDVIIANDRYTSETGEIIIASGISSTIEQRKSSEEHKTILQDTKKIITEGFQKLPSDVSEYLRVSGQTSNSPVTLADMHSALNQFKTTLQASFNASLIPPPAPVPPIVTEIESLLRMPGWGDKYKRFLWKGQLHVVPENYQVPQVPCKQLWMLYFFGNEDNNLPIGPLKDCTAIDFPHTVIPKRKKKDGTCVSNRNENDLSRANYHRFSKAKKVCLTLEAHAKSMGYLPAAQIVSRLTREEGAALFDRMQDSFMRWLGKTTLSGTFTTIYNDILKKGSSVPGQEAGEESLQEVIREDEAAEVENVSV
jgi:hypothetical protein